MFVCMFILLFYEQENSYTIMLETFIYNIYLFNNQIKLVL